MVFMTRQDMWKLLETGTKPVMDEVVMKQQGVCTTKLA